MKPGPASAPWRALLLLLGALGGLACPGTMHEVEGRRVFNPLYRVFLDGRERDRWQKPDEVVDALGVAPGSAVADLGAGTGYFSGRLARAVGDEGRVFATDVQDEMIRALEERVAREELRNVSVVRASFDDPALPAACCDLVLLANVYKEISERPAYLRRLAPALRAGGRVAIIDFHPDAPGAGPPREARLPEEQVVAELGEAGFVLAERHDFLPRQYFLVFARAPGG
jgi:ubiquinone/menaquinone biosynthesis C-methylase UbiE